MFIRVDDHRSFSGLDRHRNDFRIESSGLDRPDGSLMTDQGQLVLLLAADIVFLRQIFRRIPHVVAHDRTNQSIVQHAVQHLTVPHTIAFTRSFEQIRRLAHAFDPDGDRNVAFAQHDGLTRNFKRFHAGTTLLINGAGVSLYRHAAFQLHLPARISLGSRFVDLTAGQLLHLRRSYSRLFKGCIDCCHAQIHSAHIFEFSQKISNRRSLGSYYPNFMHILLPLSYAFESGSSAGNNPGA